MPSFNGVDNFGPVARFRAAPQPNQVQLNAYPGVSGLEGINLGSRGSTIDVTGQMVGPNNAALAAAQDIFWAWLRNRTVANLVDNLGRVYPETYCEAFEPADEDIHLLADGSGVILGYFARFRSTY